MTEGILDAVYMLSVSFYNPGGGYFSQFTYERIKAGDIK